MDQLRKKSVHGSRQTIIAKRYDMHVNTVIHVWSLYQETGFFFQVPQSWQASLCPHTEWLSSQNGKITFTLYVIPTLFLCDHVHIHRPKAM